MEILTGNGAKYRTKLMSEDRAKRFESCLRANGRFQDVAVEESRRTTNWCQRHFVTYSPTNERRHAQVVERHQSDRKARANGEAQAYLFVMDTDSIQPFCWVFNPASGETYEVTLFDCSCPDYRYRCQGVGIRCKHMLALSGAAERGDVGTW